MAKKDFSQLNTGRVYNTIAEATAAPAAQEVQEITPAAEAQEAQTARKPRKTYTEQEAVEFMQRMKTSGHKGVKLPRINLAFAPELYDYVQTMSRVRGETMTDFVNVALRAHMEDNRELYEKAIEFKNSL